MTTVRAFADRDFDELVARWHETNRASYPYVRLHQEHTLDDARRFFRTRLLTECRVWVAEVSEKLAGLVALEDVWIRNIAAFAEFQRQGVGTTLLQTALQHSPAQLRLFTFQRNAPARAFYERHGFTAVAFGTSPAPESEPDVEYRWTAPGASSRNTGAARHAG